jgi:hypothetical protein
LREPEDEPSRGAENSEHGQRREGIQSMPCAAIQQDARDDGAEHF